MYSYIERWDSSSVASWVHSIGYGQYEKRFRENDITGEILLNTDLDMLKELKIKSIGHRIAILKAVRHLRVENGYDATPVDEDPLSATQEPSPPTSDDLDKYVSFVKLDEELRIRDAQLQEMATTLLNIQKELQHLREFSQPKTSSTTSILKTLASPLSYSPKLSNRISTKKSSPELSTSPHSSSTSASTNKKRASQGAIRVYGHKLFNHENEAYKSVMISVYDSCSVVLPHVLKKWKVEDDWKKYALFMVFKGREKCLSYNDRPLALLLHLKEGNNEPVFYLKALRTTSMVKSMVASEKGERFSGPSEDEAPSAPVEQHQQATTNPVETAVAIYEYKKDREDELDVNIGDHFIIRDKSTAGWWVVEKDGKSGWVPAGCLMEKSNDEEELMSQNGPVEALALYDYTALGVNELSITKGDKLWVNRKYQHWLFAECGDAEGWVPSCYVALANTTSSLPSPHDAGQNGDSTPTFSSIAQLNAAVGASQQAIELVDSMQQSMNQLSELKAQEVAAVEETNPSTSAFVSEKETRMAIDKVMNKIGLLHDSMSSEKAKKNLMEQDANGSFAALNKLDSLMDSMDSLQFDDVESDSRKSKLSEILKTMSTDLADIQHHNPSIGLGNDIPVSNIGDPARQLSKVAASISTTGHGFVDILHKLETVSEQQKSMVSNPIQAPADDVQLNSVLQNTYAALSDVSDYLLSEKAKKSNKSQGLGSIAWNGAPSIKSMQSSDSLKFSQTLATMDNQSSRMLKVSRSINEKQSIYPHTVKKTFASELANRDNTNNVKSPSGSINTFNNSSEAPSANSASSKSATIPYRDLVERRYPDLDYAHIERYLSNEDCLQYLGCTKEDLIVMPAWQLLQRKKRANLYME